MNRLSVEVSKYHVGFAPSRRKVLLCDWLETVPALILYNDPLEMLDGFEPSTEYTVVRWIHTVVLIKIITTHCFRYFVSKSDALGWDQTGDLPLIESFLPFV